MSQPTKTQLSLLAMAVAVAYPLQAGAAAGTAQFTAGDVNLRRADGKSDPLVKGKDIESGQAIVTGANGRAQLKFSDGGLVSLQPNSEFRIANYVDEADPKKDRFLVDLLSGGMRALTGLIGKRNRENYRVTTSTATIGIRGSGFSSFYNPDGTMTVTTELDAIEVCTRGGCAILIAGESVLVRDNNTAPVRTRSRINLPVDPVTGAQLPDVAGNQVDKDGRQKVLGVGSHGDGDSGQVQPGGNTGVYNGVMTVATHYQGSPGSSDPYGNYIEPIVSNSVTMSSGIVSKFEANSGGYMGTSYVFEPVSVNNGGSLGSVANNDFIGWGNWASANKNGSTPLSNVHYVLGQATAVLPTTTGILTYSLVGGSAPTSYTGASGTISNASNLLVDFASGTPGLTANIVTSFGSINQYLYLSGSSFTDNNSIRGLFTGPNANRAGLVYTGYMAGGTYSGSAIFAAP